MPGLPGTHEAPLLLILVSLKTLVATTMVHEGFGPFVQSQAVLHCCCSEHFELPGVHTSAHHQQSGAAAKSVAVFDDVDMSQLQYVA